MVKARYIDIFLRIALAVLTASLIAVITDGLREPHVTVAGDVAPDFTIITEHGARVTAKDFRGRVLVLNFWASWCVPCIEETPSLREFQGAFQRSGLTVLGISIDTEEQAYRNFLRRFRVNFETARDPDRKMSSRYGTIQIPETYVIDKQGVVAAKIISNRNWMDPEMFALVKPLL